MGRTAITQTARDMNCSPPRSYLFSIVAENGQVATPEQKYNAPTSPGAVEICFLDSERL